MKLRFVCGAAVLAAILAAAPLTAGERTQSYPAQKGGTLEVRVDAGVITVQGWEKNEVFVRVTSLDEEQLKKVTFAQSGATVTVEFDWRRDRLEEIRFDVMVPSSFNADLRTGGGDLSLKAPLNGTLKGSTAGGSIELGDIGGTIKMETAGGEIAGGTIRGDLSLNTAGGDIRVKGIDGSGEINTAGGSVQIDSATKPLRVSTAGGDILIGKTLQDLALSTAGGNIKVGSAQGEISMSTAGGSIAMTSGRGNVQANSAAGNIRLDKIEGSVNARTSAGNVTVQLVPDAGGASSLVTSAGNVLLRIPETARATIRARSQEPVLDFEEGEGDDFIRSDFPLSRADGKRRAGEAEVKLNGGGQRILLETTIGVIEIRKAK